MGVWEYAQAFVIIGVVIFAAYYVTRLVARTGFRTARKQPGMQLLASMPLARDKSVAILELGEYAYVLGVSPQSVQLLDKIPLSQLPSLREESAGTTWASAFQKELAKRLKKSGK